MSFPLKALVDPLVAWYELNRKTFPWRENPTPYRVWISEIMLQQTRIEAALPYYTRFLEAFPDARTLASAEEEKVLKLWQGLGYYSRAKNLQKAAKIVCETYHGELPRSAKELRALPGIGDYTAGAIASIAMGLPEPAVDGNVLRVIMRLTACEDDVMRADVKTRVAGELRQIYPSGEKAGLLTQGLMELGETVCLPAGEVKCGACPLSSLCLAYASGKTAELPVRAKPKPRVVEDRTIVLLTHEGRVALHKRTEGVLRDLWEPVNLAGKLDLAAVEKRLSESGVSVVSSEELGKAKHVFSHIEWHMTGFLCEIDGEPEALADGYALLWEDAGILGETKAVPSAFRAYRKKTGLL